MISISQNDPKPPACSFATGQDMRRLETALQTYAWGKCGSDSMVAQLKKVNRRNALIASTYVRNPGASMIVFHMGFVSRPVSAFRAKLLRSASGSHFCEARDSELPTGAIKSKKGVSCSECFGGN